MQGPSFVLFHLRIIVGGLCVFFFFATFLDFRAFCDCKRSNLYAKNNQSDYDEDCQKTLPKEIECRLNHFPVHRL